MEGTIKFYNARKSFGFIKGVDGTEYFVHRTQILKGANLDKDMKVEFTPTDTEKGKQALNVRVKK